MKHPESPSAKDVLDAVNELPTKGTLTEDKENGMVYLDLDDDWIFKALTVLRDYGYIRPPFFAYPPFPVGAHIKIVTKREAEDYELLGEKGRKVADLIGKTVNFEVVTAHVSYPRIRKFGVEARYKIRIKSQDLVKIRKELTGLSTGPNNGHFVILVGLRNPELNKEMNEEEFEKKLSPDEKHSELEDEEVDVDGSRIPGRHRKDPFTLFSGIILNNDTNDSNIASKSKPKSETQESSPKSKVDEVETEKSSSNSQEEVESVENELPRNSGTSRTEEEEEIEASKVKTKRASKPKSETANPAANSKTNSKTKASELQSPSVNERPRGH